MNPINVDLPESMERFVQDRVSREGHADAGESIWSQIRSDQEREAEGRVDSLPRERLSSGGPIDASPVDWEGKKEQVARRLADDRPAP